MATTLRKIADNYYARVRWSINLKQKEKTYNLYTQDPAIADERLSDVEDKEHLIIADVEFSFWWMNGDFSKTHQVVYTLADAIEEFLKHLRRYGAVENTIERRRQCLYNLASTLKPTFPVRSLDGSSIDKFIDKHKGRLTDVGINMHLAHIRSLINWLYDEKDMFPKRIKVRLLKVDAKEPHYLTQYNIELILSLTEIDNHCKDAFQFYWETGLRLREPYNGTIKNGHWLIIPKTKNRKGKRIELLPHHIPIWKAMMARFNSSKAQYRSKTGYYSRQFKKAVRLIGRTELHFHNLRDTFAIIRYIQTRNIYDVSKELHHSSVGVTEKYANYYSMKELLSDWKCLVDVDFEKLHMPAPEEVKSSSPLMGVQYGLG